MRILSWDPGKITGFAEVWWYPERDDFFVSEVSALTLGDAYDRIRRETNWDMTADDRWVVERFDLNPGNDFVAQTIGIRVEGAIEGSVPHRDRIVWRSRADKAQVPDEILKEHNLWRDGSDVDWDDGRDVNDALKHAIGCLAFNLKDRKILRRFFK